MDKINLTNIIRKHVRVINIQGSLVFYKQKHSKSKEIQNIDLNYAQYLYEIGGEQEIIKTITQTTIK
jgi:hypothetical protein